VEYCYISDPPKTKHMSKLFAMAFPILPGKTEEWRSFMQEINTTYAAQFAASREALGVRERTFLQSTPMGDLVLVTLEGEDPIGAFTSFTQQQDEFARWFLGRVGELHGVDLSNPPEGPLPEMIVDSRPAAVYN
jgi:hypothetical protein